MSRMVEEMKAKGKGISRGRRVPVTPVSWYSLDWSILGEYIDRITQAGCAVRLGLTRDLGAYAIGVYGDGDQPYTDYLRPGESVEDYFHRLADDVNPEKLPNT